MRQRAAMIAGVVALCVIAAPVLAAEYELASDADLVAREIARACSDAVDRQAAPVLDEWRVSQPLAPEALSVDASTVVAEREYEGLGTLRLKLTTTVVDGAQISHCSVSILDPERPLQLADFGKAERLAGSVSDTHAAWFRDDNKMIVTVMTRTDPDGFLFTLNVIADASR